MRHVIPAYVMGALTSAAIILLIPPACPIPAPQEAQEPYQIVYSPDCYLDDAASLEALQIDEATLTHMLRAVNPLQIPTPKRKPTK